MFVSAGRPARAAHDGNALPLASVRAVRGRNGCRIQLEVVANEEIEVAVPVVIEKRTTGAPANLRLAQPGLMRDIGKRAISVVTKKNVVSPETAKQVVPPIVVVVADTDAGLPAGAAQSRFLRDIGKRAIAIVLVQMRNRRLSRRPMGIEPVSIRKVDVQPAVVVIVKERQPASLGLNDGPLVVDAAPHIGAGPARPAAPH